MKKLGLFAIVVLVATPCLAQKVNVDFDDQADFSKYRSYAYQPGVAVPNPLMDERIVNAIAEQLSLKGFTKAEENPDVYVTYHASGKQEVRVTATSHGYGYRRGWSGGGTTTGSTHTYLKGTLVVDIWDAETKKLVWRGTATDTVSDKPEKNEKKINKSMEKMFKKYPPKPTS